MRVCLSVCKTNKYETYFRFANKRKESPVKLYFDKEQQNAAQPRRCNVDGSTAPQP